MYQVLIRNNETGEERLTESLDLEWFGGSVWTEGTFSCDCNLAIFFYPDDNVDIDCSDHLFTAVHAVLEDGTIVKLEV